MEKTFNWAIIGAGGIAEEMAHAFVAMNRRPFGVAGRSQEKARAFAQRCGADRLYESSQQAFADPEVDIVYLATPHNTHAVLIEQALDAGKHVLCEKAITLNRRELERCAALAREKGLVLAEAMTIWHMPLYRELWRRLASGEWGWVQLIQLNFGSFKPYDMTNRFFNPELAGGALLDIGVYALSCARSFLSSAPDQVLSRVKLAPTGHRCLCPQLRPQLFVQRARSGTQPGEAGPHRHGRTGSHPAAKSGKPDGHHHYEPALQAAQAGGDWL